MLDSNSEILLNDSVPNDPHRRKPNIETAESRLGWKPKINLDTGLKKTIKYFKRVMGYGK